MTPAQLATQESLAKTFTIAVLLTGDAQLAEFAMLESIESLTCDAIGATSLLERTVETALDTSARVFPSHSRETGDLAPWLPAELRHLLSLPRLARTCFVLRTLASVSRQRCAELLHMGLDEVDRATCQAMETLARPTVTNTFELAPASPIRVTRNSSVGVM